ncbi:hypothetical protein [Hymenobacter sp. B81]|uniref:hypothetical protein n=1 Tax=Hymenobacter sp. B81 TaxID=3344878 RepID=UPI0037DC72B3
MKTTLLSLLSGAVLLAPAAQAQDSPSAEHELAQQLGTERLPISLAGSAAELNETTLTQTGSHNSALVRQLRAGEAPLGNLVYMVQAGTGNSANLGQTGAGNRTVVEQFGNGNQVESDINGLNTESRIRQSGTANRVDQELNVDNRRYLVEQNGRNNELVQREQGATTPGYEVHMRGTGIRIVIEQGRVLP